MRRRPFTGRRTKKGLQSSDISTHPSCRRGHDNRRRAELPDRLSMPQRPSRAGAERNGDRGQSRRRARSRAPGERTRLGERRDRWNMKKSLAEGSGRRGSKKCGEGDVPWRGVGLIADLGIRLNSRIPPRSTRARKGKRRLTAKWRCNKIHASRASHQPSLLGSFRRGIAKWST